MIDPVVGSGSWPAWMARVEKPVTLRGWERILTDSSQMSVEDRGAKWASFVLGCAGLESLTELLN